MYRGYTSNTVGEQKQAVSSQIFHLGRHGKRKKHHDHIMVKSIINRGLQSFSPTAGTEEVISLLLMERSYLDSDTQTSPHLLTVPRTARMKSLTGWWGWHQYRHPHR